MSETSTESRRLGTNAFIYIASAVMTRGLMLILTPFYTRAMSQPDFAAISVANTVSAALTLLFTLALHGAIPRLWFEHDTDDWRGTLVGTLSTFLLFSIGSLAAIIEVLGRFGVIDVFRTVRFVPHLELVLWTAVFSAFAAMPTTVLQTQEKSKHVALLSMTLSIVQVVLTIVFVLGFHQGAVGVLRAGLISSGLGAVYMAWLTVQMSTRTFSREILVKSLLYTLPLIPHQLATWALAISDRLIIERYVSAADVARYSLAYMFCIAVSIVGSAANSAFSPMAMRLLKDPERSAEVPPLGTGLIAAVVWCGLCTILGSPYALVILAPRTTYSIDPSIVSFVVLGAVFQCFYFVWSTGTWFSMKTRLVPVVTIVAAGINIALNLLLVPRFGILAAAFNTAITYGASALFHGALAHRLHPIAWEYGRWAKLAAAAVVCFLLARLTAHAPWWLDLLWRVALCLVGFIASLWVLRFFRRDELNDLVAMVRRRVRKTA